MNSSHDKFLRHYHETKDKLFNYLMVRLSFNRPQAEDLLMDVFLKAYENFGKFNPEKGSFSTWIFTVAHNHLVNHWRDDAKRKTTSLDKLEESGYTAASIEAEDRVSPVIQNEKIEKVLNLMSDSEKEIITLRYLQDLEFSEIAEVLNKKEGTIRTSLSRAMKHFSEIYQKLYR